METVNKTINSNEPFSNAQLQQLLTDSWKRELTSNSNLFAPCTSATLQETKDGYLQFKDKVLKKKLFTPSDQSLIDLEKVNVSNLGEGNLCQYVIPPKQKKRRKNLNEFNDYSRSSDVQSTQNVLEIPHRVFGNIFHENLTPEDIKNSTEARVQEVMLAAKSVFSKRTRTLYHWMHPNVPKHRINAAVSSSWESLATEEKQYYISQVLGKFGFPQCNLMINPRLGGIKELPPLPGENNDPSSNELQNAISSITSNSRNIEIPETTIQNNFQQTSGVKRRLGRPPGSKNKRPTIEQQHLNVNTNQEFQDDPELSEELEQFIMNLNLPY